MWPYYLAALVSVFLQSVVGGLFWPGLVVAWAAVRVGEAKRVYGLAFGTGLLGDFLVGRTLGTTAVFLLLTATGIYVYKSRFRVGTLVLSAMVLLEQWLYYLVLWRWVS